jgi:hypothetical protein
MAVLNIARCGRPPGWRRFLPWFLGLLLGCAASLRAAAPPPPAEFQVKAVFLFNFAQFVDWPASAFPDPHAPVTIAILGKDPFGSYLDELVRDEMIGERPLKIRRCSRTDELAGAHIVFISRSENKDLETIMAQLKGHWILTVGDSDNFTRYGGMVRFVKDGGKIRLRINVEAAKASHLTISSKVLRPDTIVTLGKD